MGGKKVNQFLTAEDSVWSMASLSDVLTSIMDAPSFFGCCPLEFALVRLFWRLELLAKVEDDNGCDHNKRDHANGAHLIGGQNKAVVAGYVFKVHYFSLFDR